MIVELIRLETSFDHGTIGALRIDKKAFCWTLEPKKHDNLPSVSCIPSGCYQAAKKATPSHGVTYQVLNVPKRTAILFHPGNTKTDTEGCILLGSRVGNLGERRAVLNSGKTFETFMELMWDEDVFQLIITENF